MSSATDRRVCRYRWGRRSVTYSGNCTTQIMPTKFSWRILLSGIPSMAIGSWIVVGWISTLIVLLFHMGPWLEGFVRGLFGLSRLKYISTQVRIGSSAILDQCLFDDFVVSIGLRRLLIQIRIDNGFANVAWFFVGFRITRSVIAARWCGLGIDGWFCGMTVSEINKLCDCPLAWWRWFHLRFVYRFLAVVSLLWRWIECLIGHH